jgi:hypothetical protein
MTKTRDLTVEQKESVLNRALKVLDDKFYQPEKLGNGWKDAIARHRPAIIDASTAAAFEEAVTRLAQLRWLGSIRATFCCVLAQRRSFHQPILLLQWGKRQS